MQIADSTGRHETMTHESAMHFRSDGAQSCKQPRRHRDTDAASEAVRLTIVGPVVATAMSELTVLARAPACRLTVELSGARADV